MRKNLLLLILYYIFCIEVSAQSNDIKNVPIPDIEYQALVDLYNSTGGSGWYTKWNVNENNLHEGAWHGITIENGHIVGINLNGNRLTGSTPLSISNLKYLRSLILYNNSLGQTDLGVLSGLESLEYLDLRSCSLKGDLPDSWGKLKKLKSLYLNSNSLTSLPVTMGDMESLVTVEAYSNQIKSIPESTGNLSNLVTLNLNNNHIELLPKSLENITTLKTLVLYGNRISDIQGLLPGSVSLDLRYQSVSLPKFVYEGKDIVLEGFPNTFYYSRGKNDFSEKNSFQFRLRGSQVGQNLVVDSEGKLTIPATYLSTIKKGDQVSLYQVSGTSIYSTVTYNETEINQPKIPEEEYQALVDLYTSTNGTGWYTKWNVNENNLHEGAWYGITIENGHIVGINLNNNRLTGSIPLSIGNLKYLRSLVLYSNNLSQTDLGVLSNLESLDYLDLRSCSLKGDLPDSWGKLKKLKSLYLNSNSLTSLPVTMGDMESLVTVEAYSNQIKSIPESTGNLSNLVTLNLNNNHIELLPKSLENITTLKTLVLYGNRISDIQGLLPGSVSLDLRYQSVSLPKFVYEGKDIVLEGFPNTFYYSRGKNDFSEKNSFQFRLRGSQVGQNLVVDSEGKLTIPATYLSTIKKGDQVSLYQVSGTSIYSTVTYNETEINQPKIPEEEYQALVDLYTSTNGTGWYTKWNVNENNLHEGAWYGITIENGHIVGINLNNNRLTGSIPLSIGNLKYLRSLVLYSNNLSQTDLGVLSNLESLDYLDLRSCSLKGDLPDSWGKLKKLKSLYLNSNSLTSLPVTMGDMESLVTVEAYSNQIKSIPESTGNLSNLVTLNLNNNHIELLPKSLENITTLKTLVLYSNRISDIQGLLPGSVSLDLRYQSVSLLKFVYEGKDIVLEGFPNTFYYSRGKNDFSEKNSFQFRLRGSQVGQNVVMDALGKLTIPASYLSTIKKGDQVSLYQVSGTSIYSTVTYSETEINQPKIPEEEYQALVDLYTSTNGTGWYTKWNVNENNLHEGAWHGITIENGHIVGINLNNNRLSGSIPVSIGNLKYLRSLVLYSNNLSQTDLGVLNGLESLDYLDLRSCSLKGDLPDSWGKLKKLKTLYLNNNGISDIDRVLADLPLVNVDFSSQSITIEKIEVGANDLEINLPLLCTYAPGTEKGSFNNINYFDLYINNVKVRSNYSDKEGKLVFKDIVSLNIKLTDKIKIIQTNGIAQNTTINYSEVTFGVPLEETEFEILKKFYTATQGEIWKNKWDISQNNLHEKRWYGVGVKGGHVVSLILPDNNLSGFLPDDLAKLIYLETLEVSTNNLEGGIPATIGELQNLKILNLQRNKLSGNLPQSLSEIQTLQRLVLAKNQFTGSLPSWLNQYINIEQLDLSYNSFDNVETVFTYDLDKVFLNVRGQVITKEEYLSLEDDKITVNLVPINTYSIENKDFKGEYTFYLQADYSTITKATAKDGKVVFSGIDISQIPEEAQISVWQQDGANGDGYIHYKGIWGGSNVPVENEEYNILVNFFKKTKGEQWTESWDTTSNNLHEKKWKGVTNSDGHIVAIELPDNNLTGIIPEELTRLPNLKTVNLSGNKLTGIEAPFSGEVSVSVDRQTMNMGSLPLTQTSVLHDTSLNRYDHSKGEFISQTYNVTVGNFSRLITLPKEGIGVTDIMSEWNVSNNQELKFRQISGSTRNSDLIFNLTYKLGDANLDDRVNVLDVQTLVNYIQNIKPKYFNKKASDMNSDEMVNILDVITLVNKIQASEMDKASEGTLKSASVSSAVVGIENGKLYIENPEHKTGAFDIRIQGNNQNIRPLMAEYGYQVQVSRKGEEISLIGFTLSEPVSGKLFIAEVGFDTQITQVLVSDKQAQEVNTRIEKGTLGTEEPEITQLEKVINVPNPFEQETRIRFSLSEGASRMVLKVFSITGQKVREEEYTQLHSGNPEIIFSRKGLSSGVYYYTLEVYTAKGPKMYKNKMLIK